MSKPILNVTQLSKTYRDAGSEITVLKEVNLTIQAGDSVAILGASGSGKSTLLHCLGGLDQATSGQVSLAGVDLQAISETERALLRNQKMGFVYQFHHLLPEFTAQENVAMPLVIAGHGWRKAKLAAINTLQQVGLADRATHKPAELSGGEKQRVAIARAMITQPAILLADEPTGNLDFATAEKVFDVMLTLNKVTQTALVMVTHDRVLANRLTRRYVLEKGQLAVL